MEADEPCLRQGPHPPQAVGAFLIQNDGFRAARTHGLDQASPDPELSSQRRRHARECGGDHDRVERGVIGGSFGPVPHQDDDIADALLGEVVPRLLGQIGPDLDADHAGSDPGEQRGLVAVTGADLEYLLRTVQAQRRDHHGAQRRLGGHQMVRNRHRRVVVGPVRAGGRHERRARSAPHRIEHERIGYAGGPCGRCQPLRAGLLLVSRHKLPPAPLPYSHRAAVQPSHRRSALSGRDEGLASRGGVPSRLRDFRPRAARVLALIPRLMPGLLRLAKGVGRGDPVAVPGHHTRTGWSARP